MVRKSRIRGGAITPKYITGLGDGHVENDVNNPTRKRGSPTDDEAVLQKAVQKRRNHPHHQASPQLRYSGGGAGGSASDTDPVAVIFPERNGAGNENRNSGSNTGSNSQVQQEYYSSSRLNSNSPVYDPWEAHAMYLVAATMFVIVTAVFMHIVSESSQTSEQRSIKSPHGKTYKTTTRHAKIRKKKTDEWNEDSNEEDDLLSESVRGGGSGAILVDADAGGGDDASSAMSRPPPPALYYPYQPRLPQHRHRRNSSSSNTTAATVVVSSPSQQHSTTQPKAVTPNRSYYLNQSGSAVIAGHSPVVVSNHRASSAAAHQQGGTYCPPSPLPNPKMGIKDPLLLQHGVSHSLTAHAVLAPLPPIFQSSSSDSHSQHNRLGGGHVVRPLSTTASSFESLTEEIAADQLVQRDDRCRGPSPDRLLRRNSDESSTEHKSPFSVSHISGVSEDLTPVSAQQQQQHSQYRQFRPDFVDKTPRAANGRSIMYPLNLPVPEDQPLTVESDAEPGGPIVQSVSLPPPPPPIDHAMSATTDLDLLFATSPKLRKQQQLNDERAIPFVPSLAVPVADTRPPKSMNIDQLHLFQLMESGNVSHWEERVAEESRQLQSRVFPAEEESNNVRDSVLAASMDLSGSGVTDSIPSDDPRKGIRHKRDDLTDSTDASSALQGAIDFSELKLVDVIGGGGFGQVWKAYWRGTPVAVKVLTGSAQSKSVPRPVLEEFAAEINLLKGMRHPNICLYMGACLEPPNRAIITELASNGSLWDALRLPLAPPYVPCDGATRQGWPDSLYLPDSKHGAPPTPHTKPLSLTSIPPRGSWHWILVKRVARGAARGLNYLHGGRIPVLHRDLKSANILLDDSYTAKVCDFGLSRLKAQERSMTGNCGTVQWMAPEVLANQSYNEKADVYSYGVILWELLTRQCPYDKMTPIQCALAVLNRNQRPEIPKWCPPSFQALIRACWKKDPDERPTFTQILAALDSVP